MPDALPYPDRMALTLSTGAAIRLTHAAVQVIADDAGLDVLHIKGPAIDPLIIDAGDVEFVRSQPARVSTDADVWVRPDHLTAMRKALERQGWTVAYHFDDGSPFRHAMTLMHGSFAPLDLHRRFPGIGIDADEAFEALWQSRMSMEIGGVACSVPDLIAQRLIVILHAVRARRQLDIDVAYGSANDVERGAIEALAERLDAEVPLAAATGRLEEFVDRREYPLWRAIRDGERSRIRMWAARVKSEPSMRRRLGTGIALVAPKADRLQATLGRRPTATDRVKDVMETARTALRELRTMVRGRRAPR